MIDSHLPVSHECNIGVNVYASEKVLKGQVL